MVEQAFGVPWYIFEVILCLRPLFWLKTVCILLSIVSPLGTAAEREVYREYARDCRASDDDSD